MTGVQTCALPICEGSKSGPSHRPEGDKVWFRLNVGRSKQADPRWLIPAICRQGGISKREIGSIRIFHLETKFEVVASVAEQFAQRVREVKGPILIEPTDPPNSQGGSQRPDARPGTGGAPEYSRKARKEFKKAKKKERK